MRLRSLGRTGLKVSELALGTMTFGGRGKVWDAIGALDQKQSSELVDRALDAGINLFDTADAYGDGDSERMLGKALGNRRPRVVIATKVGFPVGPGPNDEGLSRAHILEAAEASLRRLGTDYIDLYLVHRADPLVPLDETMRALDDLVRAGKVRYLGVSNDAAWRLAKSYRIAERERLARFEVVQAYYNLLARDIERETVPLLVDERVGLMVWSPLASGLLSGKHGRDGRAPEGSRRESFEIAPFDLERLNRILDVARSIASDRVVTTAQVALRWLLTRSVVTTVLVGAKTVAQLEENLAAASLELDEDDLARLDHASALPPEYPGWYLARFSA